MRIISIFAADLILTSIMIWLDEKEKILLEYWKMKNAFELFLGQAHFF